MPYAYCRASLFFTQCEACLSKLKSPEQWPASLAVIDRFVTGSWQSAEGEAFGAEEEEDDGGFEDLETGEVSGHMEAEQEDETAARMAKKLAQKAQFDNQYDDQGHMVDGGDHDGEAREQADTEADNGRANAVTSELKPGQELFAEDPFILEVCRAAPPLLKDRSQ
jgi:hypothetical protein